MHMYIYIHKFIHAYTLKSLAWAASIPTHNYLDPSDVLTVLGSVRPIHQQKTEDSLGPGTVWRPQHLSILWFCVPKIAIARIPRIYLKDDIGDSLGLHLYIHRYVCICAL